MATHSLPVYSSGLDDCTSEAVIIYAIKALTEKKETLAQSIKQLEKRLAFVRCLADEISSEEYKRLRTLSHDTELCSGARVDQAIGRQTHSADTTELPLRENF